VSEDLLTQILWEQGNDLCHSFAGPEAVALPQHFDGWIGEEFHKVAIVWSWSKNLFHGVVT